MSLFTKLPSLLTAIATAVAITSFPLPAAAQTDSRGITIPEFYTPPLESLPQQNGALIRIGEMRTLANVWGKATRIMYRSTDSNGKPVAVTGAYIEPTRVWSGTGARPLAAFASGTIGQGDQCAPSLSLERPIFMSTQTFGIGYEIPQINSLLARGVAVVITDYVGLGTTDRLHTYVNRIDQGHALLDAARAAMNLPEASVRRDSRIVTHGYSQGGGASGSAAELKGSYAPELNLVGSYVGAPPADLLRTMEGIEASALTGAAGWATNGFMQADPALEARFGSLLNEQGRFVLKDLSTMCTADAIASYAFRSTAEWTSTGQTLAEIIKTTPEIKASVDAHRIGKRLPVAPVRLATGVFDDIVPHDQARQLAVDWCALGAKVEYVPVFGLNMGHKAMLNHLNPMISDRKAAFDWLFERLEGYTAPLSNCAQLSSLP